MAVRRKKRVKDKGIRLSKLFQHFELGEKVALKTEKAAKRNFPTRYSGKIGVVIGKKGSSYIVKVKDGRAFKEFAVKPLSLKKLS
ncbi:MAG: 50S ribosomal protein L21e [Nanoarchaeota archaeon]